MFLTEKGKKFEINNFLKFKGHLESNLFFKFSFKIFSSVEALKWGEGRTFSNSIIFS